MKRTITKSILAAVVAITTCPTSLYAQNVNIPDANFKAYLVGNSAINTNSDAEIQVSEANAFTGQINCEFLDISDLTGIESFNQLTQLNCRYNSLTNINLSSNTALTSLNCEANALTALDVSSNTALINLSCSNNAFISLNLISNTVLVELIAVEGQLQVLLFGNNTALTHIYCRDNEITSLNLGQCTSLLQLHCEENLITSLNLSANTELTHLLCHTNELTALDLTSLDALTNIRVENNADLSSLDVANGNNTAIALFNASGTALECIQVDDQTYSATNWTGSNFTFDAGTVFLEDCTTLGITDNEQIVDLNVYPNPANEIVTVNNLTIGSTLKLSDVTGKIVLERVVSETEMNLDLNQLNNGVYIIQVENNGAVAQKRLVVSK